jgi:putative redox protein
MTDPTLRFSHLDWTGGMRFTGGAPGGPTMNLDGDGKVAPGPMVALLTAMGGCAGADVTSILEKMQVTLTKFTMDLTGRRNEEHPKRYNHIDFTFTLSGEGLTQAKADRAVELSVTKYCSVMLSLREDIVVETKVIVEE